MPLATMPPVNYPQAARQHGDIIVIRIVFPAGMTLSVMNTLVAQLEGADGPLTSLTTEGRSAIATFDETLPKAGPFFAVIQPGKAAALQNSTTVCEGRIIVSGEEAHHVAYRQKA